MKIKDLDFIKKVATPLVLLCLISLFTGWVIGYKSFQISQSNKAIAIRENSPDLKFINPILFNIDTEEPSSELGSLKNQFSDFILSAKKNNNANRISVYFRKLNTGIWTGVNENDNFAPSSMLKIATLMSYLKHAENRPGSLRENVLYKYVEDSGQFYKPTPLQNGEYTILTVLQQMIIQSDNTAMKILNDRNVYELSDVYKELELPELPDNEQDFISPKIFSRIFRTIYNGAYLNRNYSEGALDLLTYTKFDKGIVAGVLTGTKVAHKFGEHTKIEGGKIEYRELHDCGIVYYPNSPYLICIMTEGADFSVLEKVISGISKIAYNYQEKNGN